MTEMELTTGRKARAQQLKKLRESAGVTKADIHKSTGLARDTINTMESGSTGWNVNCEIIYTSFLQSLKK